MKKLATILLCAVAGMTNALTIATGGDIVTNYTENGTNFTAHIFTTIGESNFTVAGGSLNCEVLVVAGGGSGGNGYGGPGGGAGGLIYTNVSVSGEKTVWVGEGGISQTTPNESGYQGSNSVFGDLVAVGGGAGHFTTGGNGGSGGGGGGIGDGGGGTAVTGQGYDGGGGVFLGGGGGGGAGQVGGTCTSDQAGGDGGAGVSCSISGEAKYYAGGGGGGTDSGGVGAGGLGGGGIGAIYLGDAGDGVDGLGGGGGGGSWGHIGKGGSGVVIVRYPTPCSRSFFIGSSIKAIRASSIHAIACKP
jgi:hypothetical protein